MRNNPIWRRSMIRQAYKLAASRVTALVVLAAALCTLVSFGASAVSVL